MKTYKTLLMALLVCVAFGMTGSAYGQKLNKINVSTLKDCFMKQDGKMYVLKNGQLSRMKESVVLANGVKVKRNGVCILPDRTRIRMKEGNCIDNTGTMADCALMENPKA